MQWTVKDPTTMNIILHGQLLDNLQNVFGDPTTQKMRVKVKFEFRRQETHDEVSEDLLIPMEWFNVTSGKYFKLFIIFCNLTRLLICLCLCTGDIAIELLNIADFQRQPSSSSRNVVESFFNCMPTNSPLSMPRWIYDVKEIAVPKYVARTYQPFQHGANPTGLVFHMSIDIFLEFGDDGVQDLISMYKDAFSKLSNTCENILRHKVNTDMSIVASNNVVFE